ncbi:MAG TPA: hypothetical protein VFA32_23430 [Dehalococcoidia bacterium]|jgi:hypothetical protein|nr:hypothetical protein [Dehalococcoidia bacterium]
MSSFDVVCAYEGVARANAVAGNRNEALKYRQLADAAGQSIENEEDKRIFLADFNTGCWNYLR